MGKPSGAGCNLAGEYCFYRHNQAKSSDGATKARSDEGNQVSDELLHHFIGEYINSQDNPTVFFTWQGGEPTLAGLDFYRRVIELQKKHARPGITIANSIQTNGVLLDENWVRKMGQGQNSCVRHLRDAQFVDHLPKSASSEPSAVNLLYALYVIHPLLASLDCLRC